MLWDPLRFLESCPSSDGACAVVLTERGGRQARGEARGVGRGDRGEERARPVPRAAIRCARKPGVECAHDVYQQAGISVPRQEIDVAEIYVPFSWYEPMWLEGHDIAGPGRRLEDGRERRHRARRARSPSTRRAACCRRTRSARRACSASRRPRSRCAGWPASTRSTAPAPRSPRPTAAAPSTSPWPC